MKFYWRRFVTLTAGLSLFGVGLIGLGFFFAPHGQFAHGGKWIFWGLSRSQLLHAHLLLAVLLLAFSAWHIYFNWRTILRYLKNRGNNAFIISAELVGALLLVLFVFFCG